jgi:hypothetical protein
MVRVMGGFLLAESKDATLEQLHTLCIQEGSSALKYNKYSPTGRRLQDTHRAELLVLAWGVPAVLLLGNPFIIGPLVLIGSIYLYFQAASAKRELALGEVLWTVGDKLLANVPDEGHGRKRRYPSHNLIISGTQGFRVEYWVFHNAPASIRTLAPGTQVSLHVEQFVFYGEPPCLQKHVYVAGTGKVRVIRGKRRLKVRLKPLAANDVSPQLEVRTLAAGDLPLERLEWLRQLLKAAVTAAAQRPSVTTRHFYVTTKVSHHSLLYREGLS